MRLHDISKGSEKDIISDEQLEQLHKVLLMILDDLLMIAEQHGLKIILIGGTAIGALRHKGFIPWDDDIDIAMTRADYEKLAEVIRTEYSDKYSVSDARDEENYGRIIPKIRLKGTAYRTVLERDLEDVGIRVDIFLIENVYNNPVLARLQGTMDMFMGFALSCRRLYKGRRQFRGIAKGASFKAKCALGFLFSGASIEKWARWTDHWYSICRDDHSAFVSVPTDGGHFFKELTERENLCEICEAEFEGRKVFIPSNYDAYLTRIYGDYMKIPPKEKQLRSCVLEYSLGKYADL